MTTKAYRNHLYKSLFVILLGLNAMTAQAATDISCNIDALNRLGAPVNVGASVLCSITVAYVNTETNERQDLPRACWVLKGQSSCTGRYGDGDVTVGHPVIAAISGYSHAVNHYRFGVRGCAEQPSEIATNSDELANHDVSLTQHLRCWY